MTSIPLQVAQRVPVETDARFHSLPVYILQNTQ